jgi:excinuclease ABC subunit B
MLDSQVEAEKQKKADYFAKEDARIAMVAEEPNGFSSKRDLEKAIEKTKKQMQKAAKETDFMEAARLRDKMFGLEKILKSEYR